MPIDLAAIATEEKSIALRDIVNGNGRPTIRYLSGLRKRSRPVVDDMAHTIHTRFGLRCDISEKRAATAKDKCTRQATLEKYPWFSLAHLRDYLRFRTHCNSASDFERVINYFLELDAAGRVRIVKVDAAKLLRPGPFGWRMIATDLRIVGPGLMVEHYMTFGAMIAINERWLHKVYEAWRSRPTDSLTTADLLAFEQDLLFSSHANRELLHDGIVRGQPDSALLERDRMGTSQRIITRLTNTLTP